MGRNRQPLSAQELTPPDQATPERGHRKPHAHLFFALLVEIRVFSQCANAFYHLHLCLQAPCPLIGTPRT